MSSRQGTFLLVVAVVCALAFPAMAVDTTSWPTVIVDHTCTDANDAPAASAGGSIKPAPQTAGPADGFCDHDSRILTGAIVADTTFAVPTTGNCLLLIAVATAATGGDTAWRINIADTNLVTGTVHQLDLGASRTGNVTATMLVGTPSTYSGTQISETVTMPIQNPFTFQLDLNTATSWTGAITAEECHL